MNQETKDVAIKSNIPAEMIQLALDKGANLELLAKAMEIQERWEANEARKVFNSSLATVHKEIPMVAKALSNPQTRSKYASLDTIIVKTKEAYTKYGFSIVFYEGDTTKEGHTRICADVIHSQGHKETYHYDMPLDGVGIKGNANMTAIHAKGSSVSYARRYLMCMIWNIPTGDDNDGQTLGDESKISDQDVSRITDIIDNSKKIDRKKFLDYMKVSRVEDIPQSKLHIARTALGVE